MDIPEHFKMLFMLMLVTLLVGHGIGIYLYRIRPNLKKENKKENIH